MQIKECSLEIRTSLTGNNPGKGDAATILGMTGDNVHIVMSIIVVMKADPRFAAMFLAAADCFKGGMTPDINTVFIL